MARALMARCMHIWNTRRPTQHAAALAYYSMFALAPILYVVLRIASQFFSEPFVVDTVTTILTNLLGTDVTNYVLNLVENAAVERTHGSVFATLISTGALMYAATGFFVHLQRTLNAIWEAPPEDQGTVYRFVVGRLVAFAMVIGLGALLVVAVFAGMMVNLLQDFLGIGTRFQFLYVTVLFSLGTLTFAAIFKTLPRPHVQLRHCLIGGAVTASLVGIGGAIMLLYLRFSHAGTAFEAAGSLAVLLIGVYYSAQLFLAGAVFTRALGATSNETVHHGG